jgi:hypothetical protein
VKLGMTFIISVATRVAAFQVADTRLTDANAGTIFDDLSVKTTVVECRDAKVAISYTGIASIDGINTGEWIALKLTAFRAWEKFFLDAMNFLRDELTGALAKNKSLEKYGLEIPIIGLGNCPAGKRQIAIAIVTNSSEPQPQRSQFRDVSSKGRSFARYILTPENIRWYIAISGAMGAKLKINGFRRKLKKKLTTFEQNADPKPVLDFLVAMLRLHRRDARIGRLIGERCIGVAIDNDLNVLSRSYGLNGDLPLTPNKVSLPQQ